MPPSIIADAKRKAKQLGNFGYQKRSKQASGNDAEGEGHEASERAVAAMEFPDKFRKLPINETDEERMQSVVLPLLKQYGF